MLVVLAHPDDEAFGPAGTLALSAASGVDITLAMATRGEAGRRRGSPPFCAPDQLGDVRWGELSESCRILGLRPPVFLGLRDKGVCGYGPGHIELVAGLMKDLSPAIVLTLGPDGGLSPHADHQAVSRLTLDAWRSLGGGRRPLLCYYQRRPNSGAVRRVHGFTPGQAVIRIPAAGREARLAALRAHRTQTEQVAFLWERDELVLPNIPDREHFMVVCRGLEGQRLEGGAGLLVSLGKRSSCRQ